MNFERLVPMHLRLAEQRDLPRLKTMYEKIIDHMNKNDIRIWDEVYPCEFFKTDIEKKSLYLFAEGDDIAAAFVLCESNNGADHLQWKNVEAKALYIDRLGVNVDYSGRGIGGAMLKNAMRLAKRRDAQYLRLFVVDINQPAIHLYLKNGFTRAGGIYEEKIDDGYVLREYGFEIEI